MGRRASARWRCARAWTPRRCCRAGGGTRRRAGTENVAGIAGLGLAAELALASPIDHAALQRQLEQALREAVPGVEIVADTTAGATITCALCPMQPPNGW